MRKLIVSTFVSLDGVMQAPGGPEEDPTSEFMLGGWLFNFMDEDADISAAGFDGKNRDVLLGRRTYEIFAAYWPYQSSDNPIAQSLNGGKKHVASRTLKQLDWQNSSLLQGDVIKAVVDLKTQDGPDLQVIGSGNLVQSLLNASLVDEFNVWTFPVVLGHGKRLFGEGLQAFALKLIKTQASRSGVLMSTYVPDGAVQPGTFDSAKPSSSELERRKRIDAGNW